MQDSMNEHERLYQEKWDRIRLEWVIGMMDENRFEKMLRRYEPLYQNFVLEEEIQVMPIAR